MIREFLLALFLALLVVFFMRYVCDIRVENTTCNGHINCTVAYPDCSNLWRWLQ